jgi:hypothetical protein
MAYYLRVKKLNGRNDLFRLANSCAFGDSVEYNEGWDEEGKRILPHLRFLDEEDALAYVLVHGGEFKKEPPFYVKKDD